MLEMKRSCFGMKERGGGNKGSTQILNNLESTRGYSIQIEV